MRDEETKTDGDPAPFRLLRRCDEVEPRLGRLYESWNMTTGRPALTLYPNDTVEWQPTESWRGWIFFDSTANCVSLELERKLGSEPVTEWMNVLTLMTLAGQRVEDSPQVNTHFAREAPSAWERWSSRAWQRFPSRGGWAVAGLAVLALLGVWHWRGTGARSDEWGPGAATTLADGQEPHPPAPPYPLPDRPFTNQSLPPCVPNKGEVEIKGGCWIELAKKAPCFDDQAEYEGKCYLPVAKKKPVPQSVGN